MKLERKKDVSPKYLLIVLSVICIALTVISAFFPDAVKPIKEFTGKFMTPLQDPPASTRKTLFPHWKRSH